MPEIDRPLDIKPVNKGGKTIGEKLFEFLESRPENYDVTFLVGPQKKEVRALGVILKAASPLFEKEFEENWKVGGANGNKEGIALPEFDADAFQLFVKLIMLDNWTPTALQNLYLPPDQILSLLSICRRFGTENSIKNVEKLATNFMQSFSKYKDTDKFLKLSQINLEAVLSSDDLGMKELEVFACACRWAEYNCKEKGVEPTPGNIREVLGKCLFEIRFPIMTNKDFTKSVELKSILTPDETLEIYKYIGLEERFNYDTAQLPFKTTRRTGIRAKSSALPGTSTLSLTRDFEIMNGGPPFPCDGTQKKHSLATKQKVAIHGLGFLGPLKEDAYYSVSIEIKGFGVNAYSSGMFYQKLLAEKGKVFYFIFEQPIKLHAGSTEKWVNDYTIFYALKGPKTCAVQRLNVQTMLLQEEGVEFRVQGHNNQLAEILFKKL